VRSASVQDDHAHTRLAFLPIEKKFGNANRLALDLFLPAILNIRNVAGNEEIQPFDLNAVPGKVERHNIAFLHIEQELLPSGAECGAADILYFDYIEAEVRESARDGSRIVYRPFQLSMGKEIDVYIVADDERDALFRQRGLRGGDYPHGDKNVRRNAKHAFRSRSAGRSA
jgi:hypothetical protein